jgi:hypothetical protein
MFATFLVVMQDQKKITSKEIEKKCTIETIIEDDSTYNVVQVLFYRKDEILVVVFTVSAVRR